jgi:hypothetical protein
MNNYDWLISRLDAFIRKYYANQVIRGALVFATCLLGYILVVSIGEYYLYMPVWLRVMIVAIFVILGLAALLTWILIPMTKMARLGKVISHEQAATIVGRHFPEISDKLLNILQLKRHSDLSGSRDLIEASINQKAKQIAIIPLTSAVDFSKNRKYLRFLLPVALVGLFIFIAAPNVFRDASERLLQPTRPFEKPAPFQFIIITDPLKTTRNSDFVLAVEVKGNALPDELSVELGSDKIPMVAQQNHRFQYTFKNVTEPVIFRLYAAGFYSKTFTLNVVQKPILRSFKVNIDYPDYTGKKDEIRNSLGDMTLPVGTHVTWAFVAEHTDHADIRFGNGHPVSLPRTSSIFGYQYRFMNDTSYAFILRNDQTAYADSFRYNVQVIPDQFPVVQLQEFKDSVTGKQVLLNGSAGDDYGIAKLLFNYEISDEDGKVITHQSLPVKFTPGTLTSFQYYFDIQNFNLQPGEKLSYYVEAWDNDAVHGSKASRSEVMTYQMYNVKQIDSAINANSAQINSSLSNSSQKTQQLQTEYKDLQTKMLNSDKMDWEHQQILRDMMTKHQELQSQLESVKKRFDEQKKQSEQKQYSDQLKDKQNDLEKQLDNLLNNELKEQMKKLQELMQKLNKENAFQAMQQMQQENKLFNMDLERMKELMKNMEMDMRLEDAANKLDKMAQKEFDLRKQTDEKKTDGKSLTKQQEEIKKDLDKFMQQDMKEMQELNSKLQNPKSFQEANDMGNQAQQNMQQSEQQTDNSDNNNASKSQSKAAKNLQGMADNLRKQSQGEGMEQLKADIRMVRQLLTNLIRLSFDQEDLMGRTRQAYTASQTYVADIQEENRLHSNAQMITDSLVALGKRNYKLAPAINKETVGLEAALVAATNNMEDRRISSATTYQQYAMMHANNLALTLNEVLSNLLQMQSQQEGNKGSCNNPGGQTPKSGKKGTSGNGGMQLSDIITQQQQLGNAMQQMQNGTNKGGQQNGQQNQPNGQSGEYGDPEQLAKLAQMQAAIREQLQELSSLLNSNGLGNARELQEIQKEMDKTETDLVNRRLGSQLNMRQREILTRLLESEKAIREQEQDDKRQSKSAKEITRPIPPELLKYMQDSKQLLDAYKTVPPQLKPYYRNMVEQYYQQIGHK